MNTKVYVVWAEDESRGWMHAICATREAADVAYEEAVATTSPFYSYDIVEMPITEPLDPLPWTKYGVSTRLPKMDFVERSWKFEPRKGFNRDSAAYAERGGIDPLAFNPRKGFEQDVEKYRR